MMKRWCIAMIVLALCVTGLPISARAEGNVNDMGIALMNLLCAEGDKNVVISPVSVYIALAMAANGAEGETREQILSVLNAHDMDALNEKCFAMLNVLTENEDAEIAIADSCWVDDRYDVNENTISALKAYFQAEVYGYQTGDADTADRINQWVSDNTKGLIEKLLEEPLKEDTLMALINAVYFRAKWLSPFEGEDTLEKDFHKADGTTVRADFLTAFDAYRRYYKAQDGAQAVLLPYEGEKQAYLAILPPEGADAAEYVKTLTEKDIHAMIAESTYQPLNLQLPKLDVKFDAKLNDALIAMGIKDAFSAFDADFSNFSQEGTRDLFIGSVIHMVNMRVNEEGTEAAAVTGIMMRATSAINPKTVIPMIFNRPYAYMVIDLESEDMLFMGVTVDPSVKG